MLTLFTTWTKEVKLQLNITTDNTTISTVNSFKLLGVTFNSWVSFAAHIPAIATKVENRKKVLKSLAGSTENKDREKLLARFNVIGRAVLNYVAPTPSDTSHTHWKKL